MLQVLPHAPEAHSGVLSLQLKSILSHVFFDSPMLACLALLQSSALPETNTVERQCSMDKLYGLSNVFGYDSTFKRELSRLRYFQIGFNYFDY